MPAPAPRSRRETRLAITLLIAVAALAATAVLPNITCADQAYTRHTQQRLAELAAGFRSGALALPRPGAGAPDCDLEELDPWDQPLRFAPGEGHRGALLSSGPDMILDTEDDLVVYIPR